MGAPKALLPDPEGRAFVARIVRTCAAAGIHDLVIVTGSQHDAIVAAVAADAPPVTPRTRAILLRRAASCRRWGWGSMR